MEASLPALYGSSERNPSSAAVLVTRPLCDVPADASEIDRMFGEAFGRLPRWNWPSHQAATSDVLTWSPKIEVFERENQLVTKSTFPA